MVQSKRNSSQGLGLSKTSPVYLDNAASTAIDESVYKEYLKYFKDSYFNPSAIYKEALKNRKLIEAARARIAVILGCKASEINFTSGSSEANNLAIKGLMDSYPESNLITIASEHDSVLKPAQRYSHKICPISTHGSIDLDSLQVLIDPKTVLISLSYANNEIGTIQPLHKLKLLVDRELKKRELNNNKLPLYVHSDASQASNYLNLKVNKLGIDLMSINSSKIYGPKEIGLLFVKAGIKLIPLIEGGGQEHGLRAGTENLPAIMAFTKALELAQDTYFNSEIIRLTELKTYLTNSLLNIRPDIIINGSLQNSLPNILNIAIPGIDNEWLIMKLDQYNIMLSSGSACNASNDQLSHVLKAIGLDNSLIMNSIRISLGRHTTKKDLQRFIELLNQLISIKR